MLGVFGLAEMIVCIKVRQNFPRRREVKFSDPYSFNLNELLNEKNHSEVTDP